MSLLEKSGKDNRLLKSWRPISLINVDAKLINKILAGRLSRVLPKIISSNQFAFVEELLRLLRLLLDILEFTDQENVGGILFAANYEAAFDSLDHCFIVSVFKKFNFPENFISWIRILQNQTQNCVMNNGYSTGYFPLSRGCRQGDPISPYKFLLAMEILTRMVTQNVNIKGIDINGTTIKVLLFADDSTFLLKHKVSLKHLEKTLSVFEIYSSLKLNHQKSEVRWIGNFKNQPKLDLEYKWVDLTEDSMKILGVHITKPKG